MEDIMSDFYMALKEIDVNNVYYILGLAMFIIVIMAKYVDSFFTTSVELLFMERKEKQKKDTATYGLLFVVFAVANCIFLLDVSFLVVECLGFGIVFFILILFNVVGILIKFKKIKKIFGWIYYRYIKVREFFELAGIMLFFPALITIVSPKVEINIYSLALLAAVAETFLIIFLNDGFTPKEAKIIVIKRNNSETLYVYRKVNDDYLLCGDSKRMRDADVIKPIPISKIHDEEYYLRVGKDEEKTDKSRSNVKYKQITKGGEFMKRTITNPNKVNHKFYIVVTVIFSISLVISCVLPVKNTTFLIQILDIIKNLSYGCIASTAIAWMIECANVRNLNKKANAIYDAVYGDLKFQICSYIELWSRLCTIGFKDKNYLDEKKMWKEWYIEAKKKFYNADIDRQQELLKFFCSELSYSTKKVRESIDFLNSQKYLLTINEVINSEIERVISDFNFEFLALDFKVDNPETAEEFWRTMDAITKDLENYIGNWTDIKFYNYVHFKPYKFWDDKQEIIKAVLSTY